MSGMDAAYAEIERYIGQHMREVNMPGLVLAVTDRERVLRTASFGYSDISSREPMDPGLMFEVGSIGKSFNCVAILQLAEEGRLDLHAPVSSYLPWFEVQSDFAPITTHHLMTHTSGLPSGTDIGTHGLFESWALRDFRVVAPPGRDFRYSNVGYKTLGFLLEEVDGRPYSQSIQERVLDPLGMRDSHPVTGFETRRREPVGYRSFYDDRPEHPDHGLVPALWTEYGVGDGCQAATAADMCAYLRMFMNGGMGPSGRILSDDSFALMSQRAIATRQWGGAWYGYGLVSADIDGHVYLGHGGSTPGFMSAMIADVDAGIGVVVLVNGNGEAYGAAPMALHMLSVLRAGLSAGELPVSPPADPPAFDNAADYAGAYSSGEDSLLVEANGDRLVLHRQGVEVALERRGADTFYVPHPDLALFLLEFGRDGDRVTEAFHGPGWYRSDRYSGPSDFDCPEEWDSYEGHYRTYNFVLTNFRVVVRKGQLLLIYPTGSHEVLVPTGEGSFRVGENPGSPETLRFDAVASGRALRATLSGCPYYRTFTP